MENMRWITVVRRLELNGGEWDNREHVGRGRKGRGEGRVRVSEGVGRTAQAKKNIFEGEEK